MSCTLVNACAAAAGKYKRYESIIVAVLMLTMRGLSL